MSNLAADLKHFLVIQEADQTPNAAGGADRTYRDVSKTMGRVEDLGGGQRSSTGLNANENSTVRIKTRFNPHIRKGTFLLWVVNKYVHRRFKVMDLKNEDYWALMLSAKEVEEVPPS